MFSVALQRQHLTVAIGTKSLWYIQLACVHYVLSHLTCEVLFMLSSTCLTCTACLTCSHAFVLTCTCSLHSRALYVFHVPLQLKCHRALRVLRGLPAFLVLLKLN